MKKIFKRIGFFLGFSLLAIYFFIILILLEINKWLGKLISLFKKKKINAGSL